jgi:hypothetical protein
MPVPGLLRSARNDGAGDAARNGWRAGLGIISSIHLKKISFMFFPVSGHLRPYAGHKQATAQSYKKYYSSGCGDAIHRVPTAPCKWAGLTHCCRQSRPCNRQYPGFWTSEPKLLSISARGIGKR